MTTPAEYKAYIEFLKKADLKDDSVFQDAVARGMRLMSLLDSDLSLYFTVSRTTVNRWRTGANAPHPALRKPVFAWLRARAATLLEQQAVSSGR